MAYSYDLFGWYAGIVPDGSPRSTDIEPPTLSLTEVPGQDRANWTGRRWLIREYRTPVPPPPPSPPARRITRKAFVDRFTPTEASAIAQATSGVGGADILAAWARIVVSDRVDLGDERLRDSVAALEVAGHIAVGRAAEILDNPIEPDERAD